MRTFTISLWRGSSTWRESSAGRWWRAKATHERLVYAMVAVAAAATLAWLAVWQPLADWQDRESRRLANAQRLLEWVSVNEERARAAARGASQRTDDRAGSILPVITQAAETAGIRLARLQPESGGAVSVSLEQQSFDQVVAWLSKLEQDNGVRVVQASLDAHRAPGFVNAQLRLNAAP